MEMQNWKSKSRAENPRTQDRCSNCTSFRTMGKLRWRKGFHLSIEMPGDVGGHDCDDQGCEDQGLPVRWQVQAESDWRLAVQLAIRLAIRLAARLGLNFASSAKWGSALASGVIDAKTNRIHCGVRAARDTIEGVRFQLYSSYFSERRVPTPGFPPVMSCVYRWRIIPTVVARNTIIIV